MPDSVPDGWRRVRLGEIAEVIGGSTPPRGDPECWNGSVPWVTPTEVTRLTGRTLAETRECITAVGVKRAGLKLLPTGTVLLTTRATIGAVARVVSPVTTNQGFQNLVPREGIDATWLYYVAQSSRPALERLAGGSTFKEVSPQSVRKLDLLLPPLPEQRAIAAVLDAVDDTIERTEAVIAATEELRRALLHELLTRGVPGMHSEWKHVPGLGTVPACWEVTTLGEVCDHITKGATPTTYGHAWAEEADGGLPFLRSECVGDGGFIPSGLAWITPEAHASLSRAHVVGGDILMTITGYVGRVCRLLQDFGEASINQHIARIRVRLGEVVCPEFVFQALRHPRIGAEIRDQITGIAYPQIGLAQVRALKVPVPSGAEQTAITNSLEAVEHQFVALQTELLDRQAMKASLTESLLGGRVRVGTGSEKP